MTLKMRTNGMNVWTDLMLNFLLGTTSAFHLQPEIYQVLHLCVNLY